jgi:Domain of unknown function (DUF3854)
MIPHPDDADQANPVLLPHHLEQLAKGSGLSDEVIAERGYRSMHGPEAPGQLRQWGFSRAQARNVPGLLLPLHTTDGQQALMVYRPDTPRQDAKGREIKYELPKNGGVRLDCPPRCRPLLENPSIRLYVTEGQKKADALASRGLCAVALLGVWNFVGKNPFGAVTFLADWQYVALTGRDVRLIFDSDVMRKRQVEKSLQLMTEHLQRKISHVSALYLPQEGGKKVGVDDYLLTHTLEDLEGLVEAPRPQPQPAKPIIELLPEPPKVLSRLLAWIDGHAYATTWLSLKITITEYLNSKGDIEHISQPKTVNERRLFVMRDDGVLFGEAIDSRVKPLAELGIDIAPMDKPPDRLLWNAKGVTLYLHGKRPNPADVFGRVVKVYDHFLDFSRSLDEQIGMCRLSACKSLMTWFADAFTVLPYPWPNSPAPGSGKTKWGHCWTGTSYLGYLTSASGSFAALRDLADMGATILLDDAEVLADPQKADPDKQMLILAGNRKGVSIPVKEQGTDGRWHTRWLNAYCPRGFTSLRLPFRALQSRSIVIPLVASADHARANRDPENDRDWPVDRQQLLADLWALALWLQREAADVWNETSEETSVVGRDWERWRAIIAVARLFERHGVQDLEADMRHVLSIYQEEKDELEGTSRIVFVIKALMRIAKLNESDVWMFADVSDVSSETLKVSASQIVEVLKDIVTEEQGEGAPVEGEDDESFAWMNARSIGKILSKLRIKRERDLSRTRGKFRLITPLEIAQLAIAHHLIHLSNKTSAEGGVSEETSETSANVQTSDACPKCGEQDWADWHEGRRVCMACLRRGE